jgi:outer membrane protein TolC
MPAARPAPLATCALALLVLGCRGGGAGFGASGIGWGGWTALGATAQASVAPSVSATTPQVAVSPIDDGHVAPVAFADLTPADFEVAPAASVSPATPAAPSSPSGVLEVEPLVAEVLARHPDIRSAAAAWRAAAARYPQEVSLDDPMFGYMLGPGSWGNDTVDNAYTVEVSQKLPWPHKRQLRGDIAQAEANAAYFEVGEQRLRIAEVVRRAYYQYFLANRQLALLDESRGLVETFRDAAKTKYESAQVEQQDVLLADLELAELKRRQIELARQSRVAAVRLNTLLLAPPDTTLPPPPSELTVEDLPASVQELQELALVQRPELAAQAARIRAERYAVTLACKEFYPDVELVARYDAFWQEDPLRTMVGMNVNVPLQKQKRWAAVRQARARVAQEQADYDARTAEIAFDVNQAYAQATESRQTIALYREQILPTARLTVESARASYTAGRLDFLRLIESQRRTLALQESYYQAMAEYHQRLAQLDRAVGAL